MFRYNDDSRFAAFIGRLADVFLLNLLWLACSLPIVTIGASTVAACGVCLKLASGEDAPVAAAFLKLFKENLGQGTLLWLLNAAAIYALYLDWQLVLGTGDPPILLLVASVASTALASCAFLYAYPIAARYRNSLRMDLLNSFRICFRFFGRTLLLLALLALEAAVFTWNSTMVLFGVLVGPMMLIYTVSGISMRIFKEIDSTAGLGAGPPSEGDGKEPKS